MKATIPSTLLAVVLGTICQHYQIFAAETTPSNAAQAGQQVDKASPTKQEPFIPSDIQKVETHTVNQNLIRIIHFNMEMRPLVVIERFVIPGVEFAEQMLITSLQVNGKTLDFKNCSYVEIESLVVKDSQLVMVFEFASAKGSDPRRISTTMSLKDNKLGKLQSSYLPEKDE